MANLFKIKAAEFVEVVVPAGNTKGQIFFPDLPNLRKKQVEGIEAYSGLELTTTPSGNTVQSNADFDNAVVTLYYNGGEYFVTPLISLKRIDNGVAHGWYFDIAALNGQVIDWTKSYITLTGNIANFAAKAFVFNVYYIL